MRRVAFVILCATAMPSAAVAPLRDRAGSSTQYHFSGQEVWDTLSDYGRCYASTERKDALKLVATRPGSVEEAETYKDLFGKPYQSCLGNVTTLRVSHLMVRGAIAEGLYKKKVAVPADLMVAAAPSADQVRNISDAALCYASRHRNQAQSLVDGTKVGTEDEFAAVGALWGAFAECVPAAARNSMKIEATLVRFRIAEALWRLGIAPDSASSAREAAK